MYFAADNSSESKQGHDGVMSIYNPAPPELATAKGQPSRNKRSGTNRTKPFSFSEDNMQHEK